MIEGACLCGAVQFGIGAEREHTGRGVSVRCRWMAYCHCAVCRKQHGALFSTSLGVRAADFRWRSALGPVVRFRASGEFERWFCGRCGSKLPSASQVPGVLSVPAGTLDGDLPTRPRSHIFVQSKSPLCTIGDSLPQHAEYPPGYATPVLRMPARELRADAVVGSCLCNEVRYAIDGVLERVAHCHCPRCRKSTGSAYQTLALVARERFRFTRGEARVGGYRVPDADPYEVRFCTGCGSPMPVTLGALDAVRVSVATIDTAIAPAVLGHVQVASKAPWYEIADSLPQYPSAPPAEALGGGLPRPL